MADDIGDSDEDVYRTGDYINTSLLRKTRQAPGTEQFFSVYETRNGRYQVVIDPYSMDSDGRQRIKMVIENNKT